MFYRAFEFFLVFCLRNKDIAYEFCVKNMFNFVTEILVFKVSFAITKIGLQRKSDWFCFHD